jgi:hypothetical protein
VQRSKQEIEGKIRSQLHFYLLLMPFYLTFVCVARDRRQDKKGFASSAFACLPQRGKRASNTFYLGAVAKQNLRLSDACLFASF